MQVLSQRWIVLCTSWIALSMCVIFRAKTSIQTKLFARGVNVKLFQVFHYLINLVLTKWHKTIIMLSYSNERANKIFVFSIFIKEQNWLEKHKINETKKNMKEIDYILYLILYEGQNVFFHSQFVCVFCILYIFFEIS